MEAQVKPPMLEKDRVTTFINTLKDPYYAHLIGHTTSSFADLVIVGERVEDGIKSGRLIDTHLLQSLMEQQSGTGTSQRRPVAKRQDTEHKGTDIQVITAGPPPGRDYSQSQTIYAQPAASQSYVRPPQLVPQPVLRRTPQQNSSAVPPQGYAFPPAPVAPPQERVREGTQASSFPVTNPQRKFDPLPEFHPPASGDVSKE